MGGGKSTTMFVAAYFFARAGGLVISMSACEFTSGTQPLSTLISTWLTRIASDNREAAILRRFPYRSSPSSSLFNLIAVGSDYEELSEFVFTRFITQLQKQKGRGPTQSHRGRSSPRPIVGSLFVHSHWC